MKKLFLPILLVVGTAMAAQAQGIKFGAKAGASLTSITGKDVDGNTYKFGFHGGLMANFAFNDMVSIQPEVLYSMKGTKDKSNNDERLNTSYIDVPVMVKVATGATGLFFEAGPQVGFLASANYKIGGLSADVKDAFNNVDFGYAAGLGFQAASGPLIGLRYNGGFTNVGKNYSSNGISVTSGEAKNSAFQLYVGFLFGGK